LGLTLDVRPRVEGGSFGSGAPLIGDGGSSLPVPAHRQVVGRTAVQLLLLAAVYALALGTRGGLAFDTRAILDAESAKPWAAHWTVSTALHAVAAASFMAMGAAVVALRRGDADRLASGALLVVGASATAQLLQPALGNLGLVGAGSTHALKASFPSGHAATTLALGLAVVQSVPPAWRPPACAFAVMCSTALGTGLLALGWHYPSDVVAGFLIAGAWAAATTSPAAARLRRPGGAVLFVLALAACGCFAVPAVAFTHLVDGRAPPPDFAAATAAIGVAAALVTALTGSSRR